MTVLSASVDLLPAQLHAGLPSTTAGAGGAAPPTNIAHVLAIPAYVEVPDQPATSPTMMLIATPVDGE